MTLHNALPISTGHKIHKWSYANAAARTGASGFTSDDLLKIAYQEDDSTFWVLTVVTPTWVALFDGDSLTEPEADVLYLRLDGTTIMTGTLDMGANLIDRVTRIDNSTQITIDMDNYTLFDSAAAAAVDWDAHTLRDNSGTRVDWGNSQLTSSLGESVDWANRYMTDTTWSLKSLDWGNRKLYKSGEVEVFDWQTQTFALDTTFSSDIVITGDTDAQGGMKHGYVAKTGAYTITTSDYLINATANSFAMTLPTAVGIEGQIFRLGNSGTGTITVDTTSSQLIGVYASGTLSLIQGDSLTVMSNGANWIII